jgi:uracil phosphoribosyltransferase
MAAWISGSNSAMDMDLENMGYLWVGLRDQGRVF